MTNESDIDDVIIWNYLNLINSRRIRNFSILMLIITFPLFLYDYLNYLKGFWNVNIGYVELFYCHLLIVIFCFTLIYKNIKNCTIPSLHKRYTILFSVFWLNIGAVISGWVDQMMHGQITVFMFACFTIASMLYFKRVEVVLMYIQSYITFIILLNIRQHNNELLIASYVNSGMIVILSCFISLAVSKLMYKYYEKKFRLEIANKRLLNLSIIDDLTGIYNRRHFFEMFINEYRRSFRSKQPISVLLLDIDFFKNFNDYYGHIKGDNCLRDVAQAINKECKRPADIFARYGGEEFVVILPDTNLNGAKEVAQRLIYAVASLDIPHEASLVSSKVTISVGVGTVTPLEITDYMNLLDRADKALYKAKENGRNQIAF